MQKLDVENIRDDRARIGSTEKLMLTGDQNIIDLAYSVRWNIRDPELYLFQLAEPEDTIREVAESAMRAVIAQVTLDDAIGDGRGDIEARVKRGDAADARRLSARACRSRASRSSQADPPQAVNEAFKEVTAAQQDAQSYINQARAYALQLTASRPRARRRRSTRSTSNTSWRPK